MPTAPTVIKCRYSRCSYSSTEQEKIEEHNAAEHFECPFCGPINELYSWSGYNAHLISSHNTYDFGVIPQRGTIVIPQKRTTGRNLPCRFAPRCPFIGYARDINRHSRYLHRECPVNGCDAFLSRKLFFIHVGDKHSYQIPVQCPRDTCSSRDISLGRYWYHEQSHVDTGSEEHIWHPAMARCTFEPRCPYTDEKAQVARHSRYLHMECPVNGCDAFLTKPAFTRHLRDKHGDHQVDVQCPRDACSSRDISLGGYWDHARSHVDTGSNERISHPAMVRCTFAPRCPYIGVTRSTKRHGFRLHIECPVNGCDAFLTKPAFMAHVREKHSCQISVQCPQAGCSSTSVFLVDYWAHGLSHVNTGSEERVFHPGMARCTFAPRCPYTGENAEVERHSRYLHMECPVNGCDTLLSKNLFFKHINETHSDPSDVQCPRDGCSSRQIALVGYWHHALSHIDTGSEQHISHPAKGRCTFAPRCPHTGEKSKVERHSRYLHMECPVNSCDAFLSQNLFFKHIKETHGDHIDIQCPRDDCSSGDISLSEYWYHAQRHINKGDEENIHDICADAEPEAAGEPPLSLEEFLAMNDSGATGMEQESWLENPLTLEELLAMNEVGARGMEQEDWFNATKWNDDWDMLGQ